jgi:diguanylate cyclase (GGDEF)-like protein
MIALYPPGSPPLAALLGLLTMGLSAYVALGVLRHSHALKPKERRRWLAAAALGLGSGVWSMQLAAPPAAAAGSAAAYLPFGFLGARALGVGLSLGALALAARRPLSLPMACAGAAVFGVSAVAVPVVELWSLGTQLDLAARAPALAAALVLSEAGALAAFSIHHFSGKLMAGPHAVLGQAVSTSLLGLSAWASQQLTSTAATMPLLPEASAFSLTQGAAATLATTGAIALLLALELVRRVGDRVRRSLEGVRREQRDGSMRDVLTGLPSRQSFEGTLAQEARRADATRSQFALLLIALDGMTPVNLSYGHHGGDQVLKEAARRLLALARPHMVARLGSDEFLLMLTDDPSKEDAIALSARVLESLGRPYELEGKEASLSCSIGVMLYPVHGGLSTLITHAGVAMRAAKSAGGATCSFFEARLMHQARDRTELLRDLRLAIKRNQFELYYQPKVHAPSGQITGAEALIRWHHPERGMVSPIDFIPLAERYGLICALGDWVIEHACRQARMWRDEGLRMRVAINLSPVQLRQHDLAQKIAAALARHQINPQLLTCEITESVAIDDSAATARVFSDLVEVGVHISIDDFGTGYSNLANMRKLPANELKIDRSFVLDLVTNEEARKVARSVVDLAKSLGLQVVAEGVETDAQFQILRDLGCDHVQGYLFARPMAAKALGLWASGETGPRSIQFRPSLYKDTALLSPA